MHKQCFLNEFLHFSLFLALSDFACYIQANLQLVNNLYNRKWSFLFAMAIDFVFSQLVYIQCSARIQESWPASQHRTAANTSTKRASRQSCRIGLEPIPFPNPDDLSESILIRSSIVILHTNHSIMIDFPILFRINLRRCTRDTCKISTFRHLFC